MYEYVCRSIIREICQAIKSNFLGVGGVLMRWENHAALPGNRRPREEIYRGAGKSEGGMIQGFKRSFSIS